MKCGITFIVSNRFNHLDRIYVITRRLREMDDKRKENVCTIHKTTRGSMQPVSHLFPSTQNYKTTGIELNAKDRHGQTDMRKGIRR